MSGFTLMRDEEHSDAGPLRKTVCCNRPPYVTRKYSSGVWSRLAYSLRPRMVSCSPTCLWSKEMQAIRLSRAVFGRHGSVRRCLVFDVQKSASDGKHSHVSNPHSDVSGSSSSSPSFGSQEKQGLDDYPSRNDYNITVCFDAASSSSI